MHVDTLVKEVQESLNWIQVLMCEQPVQQILSKEDVHDHNGNARNMRLMSNWEWFTWVTSVLDSPDHFTTKDAQISISGNHYMYMLVYFLYKFSSIWSSNSWQ